MSEHLIHSKLVAQTFRIKVLQPIRRMDDAERFPVLYATDSDYLFDGLANLSILLQDHGDTPRFILVGIGYENAGLANLLRMRDLFTHATRAFRQTIIERIAASPLVRGVIDLKEITHTTDAGEFLRFIRAELMPFVSERYPVLSDDNGYFGYSAGGTFGLYALFTQPEVFNRYVIGSAGISHDVQRAMIDLAQRFVKSDSSMNAQLFMSVGELEEFKQEATQTEFVRGYVALTQFLMRSAIPGLQLTARIFPDETHATAWVLSFSHGLRRLFGPADQVPWSA